MRLKSLAFIIFVLTLTMPLVSCDFGGQVENPEETEEVEENQEDEEDEEDEEDDD